MCYDATASAKFLQALAGGHLNPFCTQLLTPVPNHVLKLLLRVLKQRARFCPSPITCGAIEPRMNRKLKTKIRLLIGFAAIAFSAQVGLAQPFIYQKNDLLVGFRKTGSFQASYEVVVDVGQVTNYAGLAIGTTVDIPNFSSTQLSDAFPNTNLNNLNWSALAGDPVVSPTGYPSKTIWLTVPRANAAVQTVAPARLSKSAQQLTGTEILSILAGAAFISNTIGTSNQDNTTSLVREPINTDSDLSVFVASQSDSTLSTLHDTWAGNVELTTPGNFTGPVRSDFYEVRPIGVVDPHTGLTNGPAYYLGYFQLNPNGTMTFTRGSSTNTVVPPPAPELLSVTRAANATTIYFTTTNGATYTLYYTNAAGLATPISSWASSPVTIIGNGNTGSLIDTTTDSVRFYRVGAH